MPEYMAWKEEKKLYRFWAALWEDWVVHFPGEQTYVGRFIEGSEARQLEKKVQRAYLDLQMPDYISRRSNKKMHLFWPTLWDGWFFRWAERTAMGFPPANTPNLPPLTADEVAALGDAIVARKKVHGAQGYHGLPLTKLVSSNWRAGSDETTSSSKRDLRIRKMLSARGFDKLNEAARVDGRESDVEETLEEQEKYIKAGRSERMRMRSGVVSELWAQGTEEEHDEMRSEVEREKEALQHAEREAEAQRGMGVDGLDALFGEAMHLCDMTAGWSGFVVVGGPTPCLGGVLTMKVISVGENHQGFKFDQGCGEFEEQIMKHFEHFLMTSYSFEERDARAIKKAMVTEPSSELDDGDVSDESSPPAKPRRVPKPKGKKKVAKKVAGKSKTASAASTSKATLPAPPGIPSSTSAPALDHGSLGSTPTPFLVNPDSTRIPFFDNPPPSGTAPLFEPPASPVAASHLETGWESPSALALAWSTSDAARGPGLPLAFGGALSTEFTAGAASVVPFTSVFAPRAMVAPIDWGLDDQGKEGEQDESFVDEEVPRGSIVDEEVAGGSQAWWESAAASIWGRAIGSACAEGAAPSETPTVSMGVAAGGEAVPRPAARPCFSGAAFPNSNAPANEGRARSAFKPSILLKALGSGPRNSSESSTTPLVPGTPPTGLAGFGSGSVTARTMATIIGADGGTQIFMPATTPERAIPTTAAHATAEVEAALPPEVEMLRSRPAAKMPAAPKVPGAKAAAERGGAETVLKRPRGRSGEQAALMADGTSASIPKKAAPVKRKNPHAESETALLKRTAAGTKRKNAGAAGKPAKSGHNYLFGEESSVTKVLDLQGERNKGRGHIIYIQEGVESRAAIQTERARRRAGMANKSGGRRAQGWGGAPETQCGRYKEG
ncbi:hypothetical protein C8R44DRAFT_754581 [Mycena epipterygia]|nr:hypothetical protein C8R44DRAFT_754581 [Mycena epipterygia]